MIKIVLTLIVLFFAALAAVNFTAGGNSLLAGDYPLLGVLTYFLAVLAVLGLARVLILIWKVDSR
jgi:hypothetical protein